MTTPYEDEQHQDISHQQSVDLSPDEIRRLREFLRLERERKDYLFIKPLVGIKQARRRYPEGYQHQREYRQR
jgi:hypothetical protein